MRALASHHAALALLASSAWLAGASRAYAQNVDIVTQDVAIDLVAEDTTAITIDVALEATGATGQLDMFTPGMPIAEILVNGEVAQHAPHPQYPGQVTTVDYPTALSAGDVVDLRIVLAGTPACDAPGVPNAVVCKRSATETFFTPVVPGRAWYLINLYEMDPFTGQVAVTVPEGHSVVAGQGAAETTEGPGGATTWTFAYDQPTEALGVHAGLTHTESSSSGAAVNGHAFDTSVADPEKLAHAVELASQLLPVYGELYGELGISPANIVAVPKNFYAGGMGLLGNVFVGEYIFDSFDYLLEQGMAHEFAHSWWGGLASGSKESEAGFLAEAFAEYSGWRALGQLQGDEVRTSGARMNAVWYMYRRPGDADIAVLDPSVRSSDLYVWVTYHKGSCVLRTLEEAAGTDAFTEALRGFLARGYGGLTVKGLVEEIAAAGEYDAAADVDQWLYAEGFPRMTVASTVRDDGVDLRIESQGEFSFRVPVQLRLADGSTATETVVVGEGATDHAISSKARPIAVEVDPRWTLVREVTPAVPGDVTLDGGLDAADLIDVALRVGGALPTERRRDGKYDPLYDVNRDDTMDDLDVEAVRAAAGG